MHTSIDGFLLEWQYEAAATRKLLDALTDASLTHTVVPAGRSLGRLAWHLVQTIPEMLHRAELPVAGPTDDAPVPARASEIASAYAAASESLQSTLRAAWTDASLGTHHDMYGEQWSRGMILGVLVKHQIHHRGQLTVLMRQAGLPVSGVYGPSAAEWEAMGVPALP